MVDQPKTEELQPKRGRSTYADFTKELQALRESVIRNEATTAGVLERIEGKIDAVVELVGKHERALYRQNGSPGALDLIEDLAEAEKERKESIEKRNDEMRKWRYGLATSAALILVDIALRLFGVL